MVKNIQEKIEIPGSDARHSLVEKYQQVRRFSEKISEPLAVEDYVVQSMPDVSPTKWHLAHVTWFWETFLLSAAQPEYRSPRPEYAFLFNSYYNSLGKRYSRPRRGLISRPTVKETYEYRHHVDEEVLKLLTTIDDEKLSGLTPIITLGFNHEQQHQELMLTDIKHVFSCNPLHPAYQAREIKGTGSVPPLRWLSYPEGINWIGFQGNAFSFDNEGPRHREFLEAFQLGSRLITNGEYLEFIKAGGYIDPLLWLSDGWNTVQQEGWESPLYWEQHDGIWYQMTLSGLREVDPTEPVCHVSFYEADAFARWAGARLPTEAEWEIAACETPITGNFVEQGLYHPTPLSGASTSEQPAQMYGDVWEWTQSPYSPYPGYKPAKGAVGEYNGKFMCNQMVLRGGSCATSVSHMRPTYRNFFPPDARWQFMGIRLAKEV